MPEETAHARARPAPLLREDGTEETAPAESVARFWGDPFRNGYAGHAVHVGNGFLLAGDDGRTGLVILKIGPGGQVVARNVIAEKTIGTLPQLAWRGQETRITYHDDGGLRWRRLNNDGAPLGPPSTLGGPTVYQNSTPLLVWGDDDLVVLGTRSGITDQSVALEVARVTSAGTFAAPPVRITHEPQRIKSFRLGRRGPEAVVGWLTGDRFPAHIGLARLGPAP